MHRIAATPGGWTPGTEGVIILEQTPAPIVVLTAADTDIQCLAQVMAQVPEAFPAVRVANLLNLQQSFTIDCYADEVLSHAQVIILRLLGGRAYWAYGLEVVRDLAQAQGIALIVLPGEAQPDPALITHSTVPLTVANTLWRYLTEGGVENWHHGLMWICDRTLGTQFSPPPPQTIPAVGLYPSPVIAALKPSPDQPDPAPWPRVGLVFYRAHYLASNTAPIDALCRALAERQLYPVPVYVSSLQEVEVQADFLALLTAPEQAIQVLLNTTSFSVARLQSATPQLQLWQRLDVPVLQVILSGGTYETWQAQPQGLSPRDMAMNVALPEVDGRIITRAISFKATQTDNRALETEVVVYEPVADRVAFVADLAQNWVRLRQTPPAERRIALILANYPTRDGRLANGVGLDTPQSCVEILQALRDAGYGVSTIPESGDDLIRWLTCGITNDPEGYPLRPVHQTLDWSDYADRWHTLPTAVQQGICDRWGEPASHLAPEFEAPEAKALLGDGGSAPPPAPFPIPGLQLGQIFIGIQPSRGYDRDPSLNYHAPDLEPTHDYLAFYQWVQQIFNAHAIVHVGKHGNLEWLPGKSIALSEACYPEAVFAPLPHLYPFIVNDPGEGAQAKRRAQAVIIDHLTPPLTRAELYGSLQTLEGLVDEYYEAQSLDPSRLGVICDRILTLLTTEHLDRDLALLPTPPLPHSPTPLTPATLDTLLPQLDGYLCELKEAQIRDGLHIFGRCPNGTQLRDLICAIARHPAPGRVGLTRAIAISWHLDLDPLTADPATPWINPAALASDAAIALAACRMVGDVIEALELWANGLVEQIIQESGVRSQESGVRSQEPEARSQKPEVRSQESGGATQPPSPSTLHPLPSTLYPLPSTLRKSAIASTPPHSPTPLPVQGQSREIDPTLAVELDWIESTLLPALQQTSQELTHLLHGLSGGYVPSGPAGAPTRNRPDVLPTGRNFYSVDIRAIPTESAWDVGRKAAEVLVERYIQDNGDYPQTLGLSVWGTSTMRTGGDDLAEALALLGVQPVWDGPSRRVVDFEILPLAVLGRPRVDVTLRISGFFRDAFPNLIDLFDRAVAAVAQLSEPPDQNPLAHRVREENQAWQAQGLTVEQAQVRSQFRIFGSKPGAYGAGLQGLIEAQNWATDADLARAYINWSSYAYTGQGVGHSAPDAFEQRLQHMQIVLHNQDNREHDLLDSDDYYQFHGGLTAAVRSIQGQTPQTYFGDHAVVSQPKVRSLTEEVARVYRSRVINPKWIAGVMRHGYKGAFEMAATLDYLFAYDATAHCVADHMYQGVANAYIFDPAIQQQVQQANPWALRDMAERLLEAHQRGMWTEVTATDLDRLRAIAHAAEGIIEAQGVADSRVEFRVG